jgi:hypothetical protein
MTDKDKLRALLEAWGVPFTEDEDTDIVVARGDHDHPKVGGYRGFYTSFSFAKDGSFIVMGAWE